jgi:hypothetical protein
LKEELIKIQFCLVYVRVINTFFFFSFIINSFKIPPELVQLFITVFTDAIAAEFVSSSKKKSLQRFYKEDLPSTGWDYEIIRSKSKS